MIGKTLAHYRILDKLGAGGMGEVWRAADSRLGREVALKVLPEVFARDAERMARFHREAQVLASLNHPNIASIYGLETEGETSALALELVEGPTLGDRLRTGAIGKEEAIRIALQIAEAVEYAHETGVMHRDLKPDNVKLAADGRVKVLDFGLAKALEGDPARSASGSDLASPTISPALTSPVITGALTGANVILGTAAYMSPEQARGQAVDKRADIWAFGVILFEMLIGRRLFEGETVSDTLASVLKTDPPWERLPADTPPRIRRLLRRCLQRNPKERLRDMGDARLILGEVLDGADRDETAAGDAVAAGPAPRRRWLLPAAVLVTAAATGAIVWGLRPGPPEAPLRKFAIQQSSGGQPTNIKLAPDGSAVAYTLDGKLVVQDFQDLETRELVAARDIAAPFWSPDGEWIAYGGDDAIWKIRRTGGHPVRLAPLTNVQRLTRVGGGSWGADGRIVFASGSGGLWSISAQGGDVSVLAAPAGGASDYHGTGELPDGQGWLVVVHGPETFDTIAVIRPDGSRHDVVSVAGERLHDPTWSSAGQVVFSRDGSARGVYAVPVEPGSWAGVGEPFLVAPGFAYPTIGGDGTLAMARSAAADARQLTLLDRSGEILRSVGPPGRWGRWPTLSPDGAWILAELSDDETRDLWRIDTARGTVQRFTDEIGPEHWGTWSSDGSQVWYATGEGTAARIRVRPVSGTGQPRDVTQGWDASQSPDGRWLFFSWTDTTDTERNEDVWMLPLEEGEGAEPGPLLDTPASERVPIPSPVDPLLVYISNRTGRNEIYLTTYPEVRGHWPVSVGGGDEARWRGDGRELFYAKNDSVMAVDVEVRDGVPELGAPRLLFIRPDAGRRQGGAEYSAHPSADGQTFVISMQAEVPDTEPTTLVVVQNWFEEFRPR